MFTIDIYAPVIIGIGIGIIVSLLFTKYGSITHPYNIEIFGINTNILITGTLLFGIVAFIIVLSGLSTIIRDFEFILLNPIDFIVELLLMGILPAIALLFVIYSRTHRLSISNGYELALFIGKFSILHLLLQISGYYRYMFI
jgi:hypothetical protein